MMIQWFLSENKTSFVHMKSVIMYRREVVYESIIVQSWASHAKSYSDIYYDIVRLYGKILQARTMY